MTSNKVIELFSKQRQALNLTQIDLSKKSGVAQSTISKFENDKTKFNLESLFAIADALDIEITFKTKNK